PSAVCSRLASARSPSRCQRSRWAARSPDVRSHAIGAPAPHPAVSWVVMTSSFWRGIEPPAIVVVKVRLKSNHGSLGDGPLLAIGAVADLARKRPSSIRYYEKIGLLPAPV